MLRHIEIENLFTMLSLMILLTHKLVLAIDNFSSHVYEIKIKIYLKRRLKLKSNVK